MGKSIWALVLSVGFWGHGHAATPYKQTLNVKKNGYMRDGVFTGGQAGVGGSVLGVRRIYTNKSTIERVIVEMGNRDGKVGPPTQMGYFQASIDPTRKRIVLDLAQLRMAKLSEQQLKRVFKKSPYVSSVEFTVDPDDNAGTMVLNLKRPVRLEAFRLLSKGKPARVVLDIAPL